MSAEPFDLLVIGAGSGGVRAARIAASYGARVAIVEERYLGGTCVNVGCVPKKLFYYASGFAEEVAVARDYGWQVPEEPPVIDWPRLVANKNREIDRLHGIYRRLLVEAGVEIVEGRARVLGAQEAEVAGLRLRARHLLIATGGWPVPLTVPGGELAITSNEFFFLDRLPASVAVIGGGYVAVELVSVLNSLGVRTTVLYRGRLFLRGFDHEVRLALAEEMRHRGVDLRFGVDLEGLSKTPAGDVKIDLVGGESLVAEKVLAAIGRRPLSAGIGLEEAGVELGEHGAVIVDRYSRTSVPSIWAIGDVTNRLNLTPYAIHEAMCFARTVFGDQPAAADPDLVPTAVFSQPPFATVGLTEEQARERFAEVDVYASRFRSLRHSLTTSSERTLVKLVVDRSSDRVLGAHMIGPECAEIVQGLAIALKMGATKGDFDATVGIHPTTAEEFVTLRTPRA